MLIQLIMTLLEDRLRHHRDSNNLDLATTSNQYEICNHTKKEP